MIMYLSFNLTFKLSFNVFSNDITNHCNCFNFHQCSFGKISHLNCSSGREMLSEKCFVDTVHRTEVIDVCQIHIDFDDITEWNSNYLHNTKVIKSNKDDIDTFIISSMLTKALPVWASIPSTITPVLGSSPICPDK